MWLVTNAEYNATKDTSRVALFWVRVRVDPMTLPYDQFVHTPR